MGSTGNSSLMRLTPTVGVVISIQYIFSYFNSFAPSSPVMELTNGERLHFNRREEPKLLFNDAGEPVALFNVVDPNFLYNESKIQSS